ncbi:hypothetical protein B0H14DRAFT_3146617 [Mycena olivaceomarginata]|nr:hypothetical protein B0H14DRAFT_3146617 [Mycena olivaceomarginata]
MERENCVGYQEKNGEDVRREREGGGGGREAAKVGKRNVTYDCAVTPGTCLVRSYARQLSGKSDSGGTTYLIIIFAKGRRCRKKQIKAYENGEADDEGCGGGGPFLWKLNLAFERPRMRGVFPLVAGHSTSFEMSWYDSSHSTLRLDDDEGSWNWTQHRQVTTGAEGLDIGALKSHLPGNDSRKITSVKHASSEEGTYTLIQKRQVCLEEGGFARRFSETAWIEDKGKVAELHVSCAGVRRNQEGEDGVIDNKAKGDVNDFTEGGDNLELRLSCDGRRRGASTVWTWGGTGGQRGRGGATGRACEAGRDWRDGTDAGRNIGAGKADAGHPAEQRTTGTEAGGGIGDVVADSVRPTASDE